MQATMAPHYTLRDTAQVTGGVIASLVFHALIILVFSVGFTFTKPEPMTVSKPITIEIAEIDEITQTDRPPLNAPKPEERVEEDIPPQPESYKPPTMTAEAPPDLTSPEAPDTEDVPPIDNAPDPLPLDRKDIKEPEVQKKPPPKPITKPVKAKPKNDFQTLLKNLVPDQEETSGERKKPDLDTKEEAQPSPLEQRAQRITLSEEEALRAQLARCWNVLAGAKYAEDLVVEVRVVVNQDRTVNSAQVVNSLANSGNPHFRAAADAALRALRNPRCSPLELPPEKYENWKTTIIRFDPREML